MVDSGRVAEAAARGAASAGERPLPGWASLVITAALSMSVPIGLGLVGYGELRARVVAVEQRQDRAEVDRKDDREQFDRLIEKISTRLDVISTKLEVLQTDVAQIRARTESRSR